MLFHLFFKLLFLLILLQAARSDLNSPETLNRGEKLTSPNGLYEVVMQWDGNFVMYGPAGPASAARWSANTFFFGHHVTMQADGNLVVYSVFGAIWAAAVNTMTVPHRFQIYYRLTM